MTHTKEQLKAIHAKTNKFNDKNTQLASNALFDKFVNSKGMLDYDKVKINESVSIVKQKDDTFDVIGTSPPTQSSGSQSRQFGIFKNKLDADRFAEFR